MSSSFWRYEVPSTKRKESLAILLYITFSTATFPQQKYISALFLLRFKSCTLILPTPSLAAISPPLPLLLHPAQLPFPPSSSISSLLHTHPKVDKGGGREGGRVGAAAAALESSLLSGLREGRPPAYSRHFNREFECPISPTPAPLLSLLPPSLFLRVSLASAGEIW